MKISTMVLALAMAMCASVPMVSADNAYEVTSYSLDPYDILLLQLDFSSGYAFNVQTEITATSPGVYVYCIGAEQLINIAQEKDFLYFTTLSPAASTAVVHLAVDEVYTMADMDNDVYYYMVCNKDPYYSVTVSVSHVVVVDYDNDGSFGFPADDATPFINDDWYDQVNLKIATLETSVGEVTQLKARITSLEQTVGQLQTSVNSLSSQLSSFKSGTQSQLTGIRADIQTLNTSVQALQASVQSLQTTVGGLPTNFNQEFASVQSDITKLEKEIKDDHDEALSEAKAAKTTGLMVGAIGIAIAVIAVLLAIVLGRKQTAETAPPAPQPTTAPTDQTMTPATTWSAPTPTLPASPPAPSPPPPPSPSPPPPLSPPQSPPVTYAPAEAPPPAAPAPAMAPPVYGQPVAPAPAPSAQPAAGAIRYCNKCGAQLRPGAGFCGKCGTKN